MSDPMSEWDMDQVDAPSEAQPAAGGDKGRKLRSATEWIALQQELETLSSTLREKERIVETTTAQCRRLEDELEDRHQAYDELKQELERKKRSLGAAQDRVTRVSNERQELEERYRALLAFTESEKLRSSVRNNEKIKLGPMLMAFALGATLSGFGVYMMAPEPTDIGGSRLAGNSRELQRRSDDDFASPAETEPPQTARPEATARVPAVVRTVRDSLRGGTGPLMIHLRGGSFAMGKARALGSDDAGPQHTVTLGGFLVGATEVTFEEYDSFVRATGQRFPHDFGWGRGRRPVVDVSWHDAQAYAEWMSRQTGKRYRLLSEAEWEYVASAGKRSPYWWGYEVGVGNAVCFDCGTIWDKRSTAPVGSFDPNPIGLYDTAGNVMEWVADCYNPSYNGAPDDGSPWLAGPCEDRVARGGAFNKPSSSMKRTTRNNFAPDVRLNMIGFRLARDE